MPKNTCLIENSIVIISSQPAFFFFGKIFSFNLTSYHDMPVLFHNFISLNASLTNKFQIARRGGVTV
jgi:hypothetical protein